jgi:hypothetical protein
MAILESKIVFEFDIRQNQEWKTIPESERTWKEVTPLLKNGDNQLNINQKNLDEIHKVSATLNEHWEKVRGFELSEIRDDIDSEDKECSSISLVIAQDEKGKQKIKPIPHITTPKELNVMFSQSEGSNLLSIPTPEEISVKALLSLSDGQIKRFQKENIAFIEKTFSP